LLLFIVAKCWHGAAPLASGSAMRQRTPNAFLPSRSEPNSRQGAPFKRSVVAHE
jgi:hypothetical protein